MDALPHPESGSPRITCSQPPQRVELCLPAGHSPALSVLLPEGLDHLSGPLSPAPVSLNAESCCLSLMAGTSSLPGWESFVKILLLHVRADSQGPTSPSHPSQQVICTLSSSQPPPPSLSTYSVPSTVLRASHSPSPAALTPRKLGSSALPSGWETEDLRG